MDTPFYPLPHSTVSTFQPNNSSVKWHNECQDRAFPERDMENKQDGNSGGWFRVTGSILTKNKECAGEAGQGELCWSHIEMLGTLLRTREVNILDHLRAGSHKQYKGNRLTEGRSWEVD